MVFNLSISYNIQSVTVAMKSEEVLKGLNDLKQYIQEEVNVADVLFTNDPSKY